MNATTSPPLPVMSAATADRGARRAEYLLVIYPYGDVQDKLLDEQQQFSTDYGLQLTVRNKPHITLAAFQAEEPMEDTLIRWIQRICTRHHSFEVALNNYSGTPPHTTWPAAARSQSNNNEGLQTGQRMSGTIYLRLQDPEPLRELMQQLETIDDYVRSSGCPPINLIRRPYCSIAGGLTEQVYNKAMPDYSRKTFHETFSVTELVLLKRTHSFDACKTVNIFRFQPES